MEHRECGIGVVAAIEIFVEQRGGHDCDHGIPDCADHEGAISLKDGLRPKSSFG